MLITIKLSLHTLFFVPLHRIHFTLPLCARWKFVIAQSDQHPRVVMKMRNEKWNLILTTCCLWKTISFENFLCQMSDDEFIFFISSRDDPRSKSNEIVGLENTKMSNFEFHLEFHNFTLLCMSLSLKTTPRWWICEGNWTFVCEGNLSFILIMSRSVSLRHNKYLQFLVRFERVRMMIDNILSSKWAVGVGTRHIPQPLKLLILWRRNSSTFSDDLMSFHHSWFSDILVNFPFANTQHDFSTFRHPRLFVLPHHHLITLTMTRWKNILWQTIKL